MQNTEIISKANTINRAIANKPELLGTILDHFGIAHKKAANYLKVKCGECGKPAAIYYANVKSPLSNGLFWLCFGNDNPDKCHLTWYSNLVGFLRSHTKRTTLEIVQEVETLLTPAKPLDQSPRDPETEIRRLQGEIQYLRQFVPAHVAPF